MATKAKSKKMTAKEIKEFIKKLDEVIENEDVRLKVIEHVDTANKIASIKRAIQSNNKGVVSIIAKKVANTKDGVKKLKELIASGEVPEDFLYTINQHLV